MPYRANPFFSVTNSFFVPSVGDKVDNAIAQAKGTAADLQSKGSTLLEKADLKVQDAKEAIKVTAKDVVSPPPTGVDLYAR